MKKVKYNFNVDKLRLCYRQPQQLFDMLKGYNNGNYIQFDCFSLVITDNGRPQEETTKEPTKIKANIVLDDGTLLGEFVFNDSAKYEGKCFFSVDNHALYKESGRNERGKYSYMCHLDWVEQHLHLDKNNLTESEIALDVNFNPLPQLQRLIRDTTNYDMILNGKKVNDDERINGYGEYFVRTRTKRKRYPTIYLSQKKADSPCIKIYDKATEINGESGKDYINDWNDFNSRTMWRLEVTVKNDDFKAFQERVGKNIEEWGKIESVVVLLGLEQFRTLLWVYITERLIYFRNKHTNEVISLLDIATKSI